MTTHTFRFSTHARNLMRCPYCRSELTDTTDGMICKCASNYLWRNGALDLRLTRPKDVVLRCRVGDDIDLSTVDLSPLKMKGQLHLKSAWHLSPELLSHLPPADVAGATMLDLGCGRGIHRALCEELGYDWVGIDFSEEGAPIFGDAHALPFADESFDFILSLAVLEHLRYPLVAMQECMRVLKPGSPFIGTVAFLEPFHGNSYYHHTHLGTLSSLLSAGFDVKHVSPSTEWTVLQAQAEMAFFPKMPSLARRAMVAPLEAAQRAWWGFADLLGRVSDPAMRIRQSTGSFAFIAYKNVRSDDVTLKAIDH
jgi:SAM-dependent methyltransferase